MIKNATPRDALTFVGHPPMIDILPVVEEVHISVTFTWDKPYAETLAEEWNTRYDKVKVGGPAYGDPGGPFIPGMYLKHGMVITSRGCPNKCKFCYVPPREGDLREYLPIPAGNNIIDNNLLACSREHFKAVCEMLKTQRKIEFTGGLEAALLTDWHISRLTELSRIDQMFFAYDRPTQYEAIIEAVRKLIAAGFKRRQIRCYILMGYEGDTLQAAEKRARQMWDAGTLPFAMFFRGDDGKYLIDDVWGKLVRDWCRPARTKRIAVPQDIDLPLFPEGK